MDVYNGPTTLRLVQLKSTVTLYYVSNQYTFYQTSREIENYTCTSSHPWDKQPLSTQLIMWQSYSECRLTWATCQAWNGSQSDSSVPSFALSRPQSVTADNMASEPLQSWGLAQHYYIQPNTCLLSHMKQSQTPITVTPRDSGLCWFNQRQHSDQFW